MCSIATRIFKTNVFRLIKALQEEELLGKTITAINVIEFQMRGLPHVHILLFLHPDNKLSTPTENDRVISVKSFTKGRWSPPTRFHSGIYDPWTMWFFL